jgi:phage-related tail fiber protein
MSTVLLTEQSTPATPTANKVRIFVNSGGTLSSVDDTGLVTVYAAGVTPEQVQDIIGGILTDTVSVDLVYDDAADQIRATVLPAGVNHNALQNYVANQHVDHSTVSISAGVGLSGGGDITANRTISMPNTGTAGTYRSVTTDAQGRVTAGTNPTTLAGYGITDAQPLDGDLTAVAALAGTGLVTRTAANTMATRTLTAGAGITVSNGDGVSGNPTVAITNAITAGSAGSTTQIPAITYNAQGQLTVITPTPIAIPAAQVTDFTEAAQDAVGAILTDTTSVDFTYNGAGNTISATVLPAGVNHNALQNYVANEHIDHSTVSIISGTGITGGGDLTASRTLNLSNTGVTAGTYGSAAVYPVLTIDAQGRVTTATTQAIPGGSLTAKKTGVTTNNSNATLSNLTDMALTLAANTTYYVNYTLIGQSVATGTGMAFSFNGGTLVPTSVRGYVETSVNTTTINRLNFVTMGTTSVFTGTAVANQDQIINAELIIVVGGTGGTIIPQVRSEVNGSQITIQANSSVIADPI